MDISMAPPHQDTRSPVPSSSGRPHIAWRFRSLAFQHACGYRLDTSAQLFDETATTIVSFPSGHGISSASAEALGLSFTSMVPGEVFIPYPRPPHSNVVYLHSRSIQVRSSFTTLPAVLAQLRKRLVVETLVFES
jgi:hypothetical protein